MGLQRQIQVDTLGQLLFMEAETTEATSEELMNVAKELNQKYEIVEEPEDEKLGIACDDVSGAELDPGKVKRARPEEVEYVKEMRLYDKVPIAQYYQKTGRVPIIVRWIDINKGDVQSPNYRSRIVAREINTYKRNDLFAATPPLEALKMIISMTATSNQGEIIMINDIGRAFFHARVTRDVYVQLPDEDKGSGEEGLCGKLRFSMYGTRDAVQNWHNDYSQQLLDVGSQQGRAPLCIFYHPDKKIRTDVHGDDYVSSGRPEALRWMQKKLKDKYQVKTQCLGPGKEESRQ